MAGSLRCAHCAPELIVDHPIPPPPLVHCPPSGFPAGTRGWSGLNPAVLRSTATRRRSNAEWLRRRASSAMASQAALRSSASHRSLAHCRRMAWRLQFRWSSSDAKGGVDMRRHSVGGMVRAPVGAAVRGVLELGRSAGRDAAPLAPPQGHERADQ